MVEDVPLFRQLLEETIQDEPSLLLCASAGSCSHARTVVPPSAADVLLLDLHLPDGFGFDVGLQIRRELPDLSVVVLSEHVRPQVRESLPPEERSHWSYLLKTGVSSRLDLVAAIRGSRTRALIDSRVKDASVGARERRIDLLSDQQRQVLSLVAAGMSNQAIAQATHLAPKSVEYHLTQIYQQLDVTPDAGANSRVQAAVIYTNVDRAAQP